MVESTRTIECLSDDLAKKSNEFLLQKDEISRLAISKSEMKFQMNEVI